MAGIGVTLPAMRKILIALAVLAAPVAAKDKPAALPPVEIVAAAPKADWTAIAASDLLVMELEPDAKGKPRRVVIQLMPPPFSQGWVGNIRKLAAAQWWDGTSVNRVQDNYVVQWGDADGDDKAKAKALPEGLSEMPQTAYLEHNEIESALGGPAPTIHTRELAAKDKTYSEGSGFSVGGWPIAWSLTSLKSSRLRALRKLKVPGEVWPVHCYAMVGVGRDYPPNTGSGAELYTVIGHAPRQLDRNIALVGRVIEGIEHLSSLPRGRGPLGFYDLAQGDERVPIRSIRIGSEIKDLPAYEYLSTESPSFVRYADARANRRDPFYIRPAGGADICNIPVPVRRVK